MPLMALQAQKRFPPVEKRTVDRAMGVVTRKAIFRDIGVLITEGASLVGMALDTSFLHTVLDQTMIGEATMRVVTVHAKHPALLEGMMARQGKLGLRRLVAGKTQFARSPGGDFQIRPGMNIVTIKAGDLADRMDSGIPVMQVKGGVGRMALETDKRLCRGREGFQINQGLEVTGGLEPLFGVRLHQFAGQTLDRQTTRAMTGFTIHQWHAGFLFELRTHRTGVKEQLQPVMLMAGGKAVLGADVIGIEIADNHLFIVMDRQYRP